MVRGPCSVAGASLLTSGACWGLNSTRRLAPDQVTPSAVYRCRGFEFQPNRQNGKNCGLGLFEHVRLGDGADVAGQEHLHGDDALPVGVVEGDLGALVVGPDVLGGGGEVAVQEVEQLGQ